jgi:hypothetical protein
LPLGFCLSLGFLRSSRGGRATPFFSLFDGPLLFSLAGFSAAARFAAVRFTSAAPENFSAMACAAESLALVGTPKRARPADRPATTHSDSFSDMRPTRF